MLDKNLVHALIGAKDSDRGPSELSVNLGLATFRSMRRHGSMLLDP